MDLLSCARAFILYILWSLLISPVGSAHAEPISVYLKWKHQFQFAGLYAAQHQGFFAEEGLQVTLIERDPDHNITDSVLQTRNAYGISDSMLLLDHAQGKPIMLVAAIMQHSAGALITLASSGLKKPAHLEGRKVAFYNNDTDGIDILALLSVHHIPKQRLTTLRADDRLQQLIQGKVDAVSVYLTNEPFQMHELGHDINIIYPSHYGIDLYGDMLFTTQTEAQQHPERVAAMRRAVIKGWHYALDHKEEIVDLILSNYNSQHKTRQSLINEAHALDALIDRSIMPLGGLDAGRINFIIERLSALGILDAVRTNSAQLTAHPDSVVQQLLTPEEQAFLKTLGPVRAGAEVAGWPPFELFDAHGEFQGIAADYMTFVGNSLGISFITKDALSWDQVLERIRLKQVDILPSAASTAARREFLLFTTPYVRSPMVFVTRKDVDFIAHPSELEGQSIGVVKGYASEETLARHYPQLTLTRFISSLEGLKALAAGEVDAYVDNLAVVSHLITTEGLSNLKVSGQTPYSYDLSFAVRNDWPLLQSAIDKVLAQITPQQHAALQERWVKVTVTSAAIPWGRIAAITLPLLSIVLLMAGYLVHLRVLNRKIADTNRQLELAEHELKEKNQQLQELSVTDKLTGLFNRHHLDNELEHQFDRAQRYGRPLSLVLLDLDHFKSINDTHGHHIGDEVLMCFAQVVTKRQRKTDIFGRWGGEEFLLICPETTLEGAIKAADAIREALAQQRFEYDIHPTVSAGVVDMTAFTSVEQAIIAVDQQLYRAKQSGRNRVCSP